MRLGSELSNATLRIAEARSQTVAMGNDVRSDDKPSHGGSSIDGEPLQSLGWNCWGGIEADGEYITTLGIKGDVSYLNYGESIATLGMVGWGGLEAGGEYLTTMGVTG